MVSCSEDFSDKVKNIEIGDSKENVIDVLGLPNSIKLAPYGNDDVMFDYGTSTGASSAKAIFFNVDTTSVIGISIGD